MTVHQLPATDGPALTGDRTMPSTHQPSVERVLDGQTHTVRMELGAWTHEALIDLFHTLDGNARLRALLVAELVGDGGPRPERGPRRASIARQITDEMSMLGRTSHDMDAAQADDLAEALSNAALDPAECTWIGCVNYADTDGSYCAMHQDAQ